MDVSDTCFFNAEYCECSKDNQGVNWHVQATVGIVITGVLSVLGAIGNILAMIVLIKMTNPSKRQRMATFREHHPCTEMDSADNNKFFNESLYRHNNGALSQNVSISNSKRGSSLFLIFICLAPVDSVFLLFNFYVNVLSQAFVFWPSCSIFYQLYKFSGFTTQSLWPIIMFAQTASTYLTVLISYERWVAVCQPIKASTRHISDSVRRRFLILVGIVIALSFIYNIPKWFEYEISTDVSNITCYNQNGSSCKLHH
ncbi:hypothetical protein Ciccas_010518 [Cichlidogyrus casuarinus]|uniref:G-protein coupled receptors family 1 profile domain-containing protein n=1 Tax=Cichlidogyrus casuarinus TaxID=1844966 RepID=A0ABD2PV24_9PLAT